MIRTTLAGATLALSLAFPAHATDVTTLTEPERDAFRQEVRAYLLENPEVLMEAIAVLEKREEAKAAAQDIDLVRSNSDALFADEFSWVGGNPDGDVTLVEFTDYRCSYCRKAHDEVAKLIKADGNIRFVVKELPILGEQSELSSRFAIAVLQLAGEEAYKKAHDALITFRGNITPKSLEKMAGKLDLDAGEILTHMTDARVDLVITQNRMLAQRMSISGTPTFVLEDRMLRGYVPFEGMQQLIAEARAN